MPMPDAGEPTLPDDETSSTGLRRSKRNKYHLDVAAVLKSGSSMRRDYSPPVKKWATRKPEINSHIIQQPKTSPKQNAKKKTSPRTSSVDAAKTNEVQNQGKDEELVTEPSKTNVGAGEANQDQLVVEAVNLTIPQILCVSGFRNLEQPLPEQILEGILPGNINFEPDLTRK